MKVTATIVASSALISLSSAACADGIGTLAADGTIVPMNVCIASANGASHADGGVRATKFTCDSNGGAFAETFSDYDCTTSLDSDTPVATNLFDDSNGDPVVTCSSVAECDYYHVHEFVGLDGQACGTIADAVAADDTSIDSAIWISQISNGDNDVNICESDGSTAFQRTSITDGFCTNPTTGTFITLQPYDDNACTIETNSATATTLALTSDTDIALSEDSAFNCRFFVACSDAGIITAAPTMAPTVAPSVAPTAAPSVAPSVAPSAAPTAAPVVTDAPSAAPSVAPSVAPSAAPTAAPVADTSAPSAAPTAAPTTASSAVQITSIMSLVMAAFYVIIA